MYIHVYSSYCYIWYKSKKYASYSCKQLCMSYITEHLLASMGTAAPISVSTTTSLGGAIALRVSNPASITA